MSDRARNRIALLLFALAGLILAGAIYFAFHARIIWTP
jgi:hypothetical protein